MKKPSLRVTKYLANEIPVEGDCTSCLPEVVFKIKGISSLNPDPQEYLSKLQAQFDEHFKSVHVREDAAQSAFRVVRESTEDV